MPEFDFSDKIDKLYSASADKDLVQDHLYDTPEEAVKASEKLGLSASYHEIVIAAPVGDAKEVLKYAPGATQESLITKLNDLSRKGRQVISSHKDSVEFSSKLLEILDREVAAFNQTNKIPVNINLLKRIYRSGANTYFVRNEEVSRSQWALARVYSFLNANKNKKGVAFEEDVNILAESGVEKDGVVDFFDFEISEQDLSLASQVLKEADLDGWDFNSIHDIYLEDDGVDVSFLRNLL